MAESEVAGLMQQIELEYEAAARGLAGFAITARHDFINAHMERIAVYHAALKEQVGDEKAIKLLYDLQVNVIGE